MSQQQAPNAYKYDAFISYRHVDPDMLVAKSLHQKLERFSIPPSVRKRLGIKKMGKVFRDQEELPTSTDLGRDIEAALYYSNWLIVVATPRLLTSQWCLREVDFFLELGRRDRILLLLAEGEPADSFPPQLRFIDIDGKTTEIEPMAADIRARTAGEMLKLLGREKLRLIAPMLGVSFDDLFQRAKKHTRKKVMVFTSVVLAAALAIGSFAWYQTAKTAEANRLAEIAGRQADESARQAEESSRLAEEQRKLAEEQSRLAEEQKRLAEEADRLAALEQVIKLINQSDSQRTEGLQHESINSAKEALTLAAEYGLDTIDAAAALYNASIMFPVNNTFARLTLPGDVSQVVFSQDSSRIAAISKENIISVWDIREAQQIWSEALPANRRVDSTFDYRQTLAFTSDNELIAIVEKAAPGSASSDKIMQRYSADGTLIYTKDIEKLAGYYRFLIWEEAGVLAILSGYTEAEMQSFGLENTDYSNFIIFYSIATGEFIERHQLRSYSHELQLSNDGMSLCAYSEGPRSDDPREEYLLVQLFHADGAKPPGKGAGTEVQKNNCKLTYLYDNTFVLILDGVGILITDIQDDSSYPLYELDEAEDDELLLMSDYARVIKGFDRGEFLIVLHKQIIYLCGYDEYLDEITFIDIPVDISGTGSVFEHVAWASRKEKTVFYCIRQTGNSATFRVEDGFDIYRDFAIDWSPSHKSVSSTGGFVAIYSENSSFCYLYDARIESHDSRLNLDVNRYQVTPPYFDFESGFCITEWRDSEGLYFEIHHLESDRFENPKKVYLPGTEGYRLATADRNPYICADFGKDYAVVVKRGEENNEIYYFDYAASKMRLVADNLGWLLLASGTKSMNETSFVVDYGASGFIIFNRYTGERAFSISNYSVSPYVYFKLYGGPPGADIFFGLLRNEPDNTYRAVMFDYDYECVISEEVITPPLDAFWSDSGDRLFLVHEDKVTVYEAKTMTVIGEIASDELLSAGKALGGSLMTLSTASNAVLFYDIYSYEPTGGTGRLGGVINSINYNPVNGLCVVTTENSLVVYDTAENKPYSGELKFPVAFQTTDRVDIYVSNDKTRLIFAVSTTDLILRNQSRFNPMRYFEYYSYPLLTADELAK